MKLWIDCLNSKAKKSWKQRLDFPIEKEIETTDRLPEVQGKQRLDFTYEQKIELMERLAKMHGQQILKTMVRFSI